MFTAPVYQVAVAAPAPVYQVAEAVLAPAPAPAVAVAVAAAIEPAVSVVESAVSVSTTRTGADGTAGRYCINASKPWRHYMETLSVLQVFCEGNPPATTPRPVIHGKDEKMSKG